jgi:plastocyanin
MEIDFDEHSGHHGPAVRKGLMTRTWALIWVVVAAGSMAAAGCGGEAGTATAETSTAPAGKVAIADFDYDPKAVTVQAGTTVTWANSDEAAHTATADDGSFDTGTLEKGDSKAVSLDEPGTYTYYCRFHAFMTATVEVE